MQGSGSSAGAAADAPAAGAEGDDGGMMGDDGVSDGRRWFVGERISIADVAVADLVGEGVAGWLGCVLGRVALSTSISAF